MYIKHLILFFLCYIVGSQNSYSQSSENQAPYNVSITITNIRSSEGTIYVAIFYSQKEFEKDDNFERVPFSKAMIADGTLRVNMRVNPGVVGLSLFDDEDNDGEMDKNFLGMPQEGFGFSDYYHTSFSRPVFDDFKFEVMEEEVKDIVMKIRYL